MPHLLLLLALLCSTPIAALRKSNRSYSGGKVITLGDSYSSGVGIHQLVKDYEQCPRNPEKLSYWCCRTYDRIAGAQYAKAVGMTSFNKACGGREVHQGVEDFNNEVLKQPEFAADVANRFDKDVIHFTFGGNDLRSKRGDKWGQVLVRCMAAPMCHKREQNQIANFDKTQAELDMYCDHLARHAGKARIRAMGYPRLLTWEFPCLTVPGITRDEARWIDAELDEWNSRINQSVAKVRRNHPGVDFEFVPVDRYLTRGACSTRSPHVSAFKLAFTLMSPMTFHPSPVGYDKYYEALRDSLR